MSALTYIVLSLLLVLALTAAGSMLGGAVRGRARR